jgi:hypothetical protein
MIYLLTGRIKLWCHVGDVENGGEELLFDAHAD